jgi:hypothetical protein
MKLGQPFYQKKIDVDSVYERNIIQGYFIRVFLEY